jgi:hypothetical protein
MAQEQAQEPLSQDELAAFTRKLEAWGEGLSPREQAFLLRILESAASDVEGYTGQGSGAGLAGQHATPTIALGQYEAWPCKWYVPELDAGRSGGLLLPYVQSVAQK